jgi:hypothetical protein
LWPGVDLRDQVSTTGVKEDIALTQPGTAASFAFRVSGATLRANATGGVDDLVGGRKVGVIPAPTVSVHSVRSLRPTRRGW